MGTLATRHLDAGRPHRLEHALHGHFLGIRFMVGGEDTRDNFALVEHPTGPRSPAAPLHTHRYEDEYTYVLEGEVGVQVGEEVVARPGDLVFGPRGVPHAFW